MRLAFDATALIGARTGVGVVVSEILPRLARHDDLDIVAFGLGRYLADELRPMVPDNVEVKAVWLPRGTLPRVWARVPGPRIERWTGAVDVVHGPNFVVPPTDAARVVTVHDLTPFRFPELCDDHTIRYPRLIRRAVASGAHVHVVSQFVADELRDAVPVDADHVHVIPNGVTPPRHGTAARGVQLAGGDRYVLAIGTIEPRKNFHSLVRAFGLLAMNDPDTRLVIAGGRGWKTDAFDEALAANSHRDRITVLGRVTDDQHDDLLAGASAMAYPSLYEGFGLPPLEAMHAGVPVVASTAGAIPEVVGDAAVLVDPTPDALADALARVLTDASLRAALVAAGRRQAAPFTWERTADRLADLYRTL